MANQKSQNSSRGGFHRREREISSQKGTASSWEKIAPNQLFYTLYWAKSLPQTLRMSSRDIMTQLQKSRTISFKPNKFLSIQAIISLTHSDIRD